jgi:hypothetical protein
MYFKLWSVSLVGKRLGGYQYTSVEFFNPVMKIQYSGPIDHTVMKIRISKRISLDGIAL